jgi:CDK inhibitor PHO81
VPALAQSIKASGLVLVAQDSEQGVIAALTGMDGVLKKDGVLKFEETIDM